MSYALGAGAAAAPPPAGAAPAAFSSAAFTAWPLKVRVGANSPSLCPIICSVTYTGINFLPLCTAIVCPIMSGTIVERRDHVFTTFFSLRVFSASTLSRKWPSTNGPFFVERAIASLFLHAAQPAPLRVPHLFETSHRTRYTVRPGTKWADKSRAQRVRNSFHNHRPARLAQLVQHRLEWYGHHFHYFGRWFGGYFRCHPFYCSLHRTCSAAGSTCCSRCSHVSLSPAGFSPTGICGYCSSNLGRSRSGLRPVHFVDPLAAGTRPLVLFPFRLAALANISRLPGGNCLLTALHDHSIGALVVSRLLTQCGERPRCLWVVTLYAAFTTTVRVIHRIHRHAANGGLNALPPRAPGLTVRLVFVVQIAYLSHGCFAIHGKLANFAGRHLHQRQITFLAQQLSGSAGGTNGLPASARIQLQVMHHGAGRNVPDLQSVAWKNIRAFAGRNRCAYFQTHWVQDVALVAIGVVQQRDVGAAVWVVLNRSDHRWHAFFIATEIDHAILLLVATAAMPDDNFALVVTPARTLLRLKQVLFRRVFRDVALIEHRHETP